MNKMDQTKTHGISEMGNQTKILYPKHNAKFLVEIERKIKTNLLLLKKDDSKLLSDKIIFVDDVLKIYRDAFDGLLNNVTTFKNLLFDIKIAYENSLNIRDEIIRLNSSLLRAMSLDKERKNLLAEEKEQLERRIADLEVEIKFIKNKNHKLENESFSNHQALSIEKDARYTLLVENVKLKKEIKKFSSERCYEKPKDSVVLQIALEQCRKDLTTVVQKYNDAVEKYSDSIPKKDYEVLETEQFDMTRKHNELLKQLSELTEKHQKVLDDRKSLKDEIEELNEKLTELEETGTPRPEWEICAKYIGGGVGRWKQITKGLTSKQNLQLVLSELGPTTERDNVEYFKGLGFDPIIPEYLQYEGPVKNHRLSKRELYILINDIWKAKINDKGISMQDFLKKYFLELHEQPITRAEWAYNLYNACKELLDDDEQVKLFWGVLNGSHSQDIYYYLKADWDTLRKNTLDAIKMNETGINIAEFEKIIKTTYAMKSDVEIQNIIEAAKKQLKLKLNSLDIDVIKLFTESEEGFHRTDLGKELYRQRQISQEKYIKEIIVQLGGRKNLNKLISVESLKRAFVIIDPHIDHIIMELNIRWIFSDKTSDLNMIYPITLRTLISKLSTGNIQRVGLKHGKFSRVTRY
ncbi:translin-associated factor X-interacting protein 1-like [Arctopsyche grandis]|uniref:translin-associated factor X-interacting protein 1-like n=1 Tax=Arctopsyche grandis TaxID=121162 RepID=UPI00406D8A93